MDFLTLLAQAIAGSLPPMDAGARYPWDEKPNAPTDPGRYPMDERPNASAYGDPQATDPLAQLHQYFTLMHLLGGGA